MQIPINDTGLRTLAAVVALVAAGMLLQLLSGILMPFVVALALAYLWDPAVDRLERAGLSRTLGVCLVFLLWGLLLLVLLLVLVPLLGRQMHVVAAKVPLAV
ncbi:MAG: AI-2E family transporter, partial [Gammaproteobacteria bacterium]